MLQHAMAPPPPPRSPAPVPPPLPATEDMDDSIGEIQPVGTNETGAQAPTIEPPLVSLDEDPAYLLFHYPPSVDREDRVYFTEGGLLAEINIMFMKIGLESTSPRATSRSTKVESGTGPATVHGFTKTECKLFIENYENLVMDGRDGNGAEAQGVMDVKMKLTNVAAMLGILEPGQLQPGEFRNQHATFQSQHGGWLCAFLTSEQLDMQISIHDIKQGIINLRSTGGHRLSVTRPNRAQAKIENPNGEGTLPLGDTIKGNRCNFGVHPAVNANGTRVAMAAFEWPPMIPVTKVVQFKVERYHYNTMVNYAVGGDSLIDRAATIQAGGEIKMLICGGKKGCKRLMSTCGGTCAIRRQANHARQIEERKRRAEEHGDANAQRKQARAAAKAEADREFNSNVRVAHHTAFGPLPDPRPDNPCPHLAKGKCARGKACKFGHDHIPIDAIRAITCQVPRRLPVARVAGAPRGAAAFTPTRRRRRRRGRSFSLTTLPTCATRGAGARYLPEYIASPNECMLMQYAL